MKSLASLCGHISCRCSASGSLERPSVEAPERVSDPRIFRRESAGWTTSVAGSLVYGTPIGGDSRIGASPSKSTARTLGMHSSWVLHTYFYADSSFTSHQLAIVERAFNQINSNISLVTDGASAVGIGSGSKLVKHLDGTKPPKIHIQNTTSWFGDTVPGMNKIKLAKRYVNAAYNSYHSVVSTGRGDKACYTAYLASTIVHEASHIVFGNEKHAYLLQYYYLHGFQTTHGYTASSCCFGATPTDWDGSAWSSASEVKSSLKFPAIGYSSGEWFLTCGAY